MALIGGKVEERWEITSQRRDASPLLGFHPLFRSMTTDITQKLGLDIDVEYLVQFRDRHVRMAAFMPDWHLLGEETVNQLYKPEFLDWIISGLEVNGKELFAFGDLIRSIQVGRLSNEALADYFLEAIRRLEQFLRFNQFVNTSDFYHNKLTERLTQILDREASASNLGDRWAGHAYSVLTTPSEITWIQQEEEERLRLLDQVASRISESETDDPAPGDTSQLFNAHAEKYFWISYEQEGPTLSGADFQAMASEMLQAGIEPKLELKKLKDRRKTQVEEYERLHRSSDLNFQEQQLFTAARSLVFWKLHLREIKVRFYCCLDRLMEEIGIRVGLDSIQVRHLTEGEIARALVDNSQPSTQSIDERIENSVCKYKSGRVSIFTGVEADDMFSVVHQDELESSPNIISGTCGRPGQAIGRVNQVLTITDMARFASGEILVAYMTDVGVVPAMRRASGIVTDVGGVTCHAAIVARELGIPCVIGTKVGTSVLKDGYLVAIDADKGEVEILDRVPVSKGETLGSVDNQEPVVSADNWSPIQTPKGNGLELEAFPGPGRLSDESIGGKAASLRRLGEFGFLVPPGFVLSTDAFNCFAHSTGIADKIFDELRRIENFAALNRSSSIIQELILTQEMGSEFEASLMANFQGLGSRFVAVRSSAPMEDSIDSSWAGQLSSFLNTTEGRLFENIKKCWASRFSERALAYGLGHGAEPAEFSTAVVVQRMVESCFSGTAFSVHPTDHSGSTLVIESCIGLGELLVSGKITPVTYTVDRNSLEILHVSGANEQDVALRLSEIDQASALESLSLSSKARNKLSNDEVTEIAKTILSVESAYGHPVDVEWAMEDEAVYIVQSRPITTMRKAH